MSRWMRMVGRTRSGVMDEVTIRVAPTQCGILHGLCLVCAVSLANMPDDWRNLYRG